MQATDRPLAAREVGGGRAVTSHARQPIAADFPGGACPAGSRVRFAIAGEEWLEGVVGDLRLRHAVVAVGDERWNVPYPGVVVLERAASECTLAEVETLARTLLARHRAAGDLTRAWTFGFDLAPSRAGVCRYAERRIHLAVAFALRAPRSEIEDTVLHEIAHAIVGPDHGHDAVWKAKAREIGCSGSRAHAVQARVAPWVGECACGRPWLRQRLQRRIRQSGRCPTCKTRIVWRRNVG